MKKNNGQDQEKKFDLLQEFQNEVDKVDKYGLDDMLVRNPELFRRIADLHDRAQADVKEMKNDLKRMEATLSEQFREEAETEKVRATKDYLDNKVILSPEYQRAQTELSKAERRTGKLLVLKEAYRERSYTIRGLIDLYVANYFETESGGSRRRDAVEDAAERNRQASGRLRREQRKQE
jgi:L-lactate utilization protein LutC